MLRDRTVEKVKAGYEKIWNDTLDRVTSLTRRGENRLSRIVSLIQQGQNRFDDGSIFEEKIASFLEIPRDRQNIPYYKLVAAGGKYVLVPRNYVDNTTIATVSDWITEDTDFVVELGSGWGRNLFGVFMYNSLDHVQYVACELTESGRRVTEVLGALEKGMELTSRPFDFNDPDLSFLEGSRDVLFFTNHAIEQCTYFNSEVFDLMMDKTDKCTCIHMEPIGWQRHPQAGLVKEMIKSGQKPTDTFEIDNRQFIKNCMHWATNHEYNTDLFSVLERYRNSHKIEIEILHYDIFGENPFNPSTLVVWHKNGS